MRKKLIQLLIQARSSQMIIGKEGKKNSGQLNFHLNSCPNEADAVWQRKESFKTVELLEIWVAAKRDKKGKRRESVSPSSLSLTIFSLLMLVISRQTKWVVHKSHLISNASKGVIMSTAGGKALSQQKKSVTLSLNSIFVFFAGQTPNLIINVNQCELMCISVFVCSSTHNDDDDDDQQTLHFSNQNLLAVHFYLYDFFSFCQNASCSFCSNLIICVIHSTGFVHGSSWVELSLKDCKKAHTFYKVSERVYAHILFWQSAKCLSKWVNVNLKWELLI